MQVRAPWVRHLTAVKQVLACAGAGAFPIIPWISRSCTDALEWVARARPESRGKSGGRESDHTKSSEQVRDGCSPPLPALPAVKSGTPGHSSGCSTEPATELLAARVQRRTGCGCGKRSAGQD